MDGSGYRSQGLSVASRPRTTTSPPRPSVFWPFYGTSWNKVAIISQGKLKKWRRYIFEQVAAYFDHQLKSLAWGWTWRMMKLHRGWSFLWPKEPTRRRLREGSSNSTRTHTHPRTHTHTIHTRTHSHTPTHHSLKHTRTHARTHTQSHLHDREESCLKWGP